MLGFDFATTTLSHRRAAPDIVLDFGQGSLPTGVGFSRASGGHYYDSGGDLVSAAVDFARFDYDPATPALRGFLQETSTTNYISQSANFVAWSADGTASVLANNATILGLPAAQLTFGTASGGANRISHYSTIAAGAPNTIVWAIVHPNGANQVSLRAFCGGTPTVDAFTDFDMSDGTSVSSSGDINASGSIDLGAGTLLLWISFAPSANCTSINTRIGAPIFGSAGAATTMHILATQMEYGAAPTSYIATTGTTATRADDLAVLNNWSGQYDVDVTYDDLSVDSFLNVTVSPGYFPALSGSWIKTIKLSPL